MSETTKAVHTPGPWYVEHTWTTGVRIVHGPESEHGFRDDVPIGRRHDEFTDEVRANMALIAAAPDLLDVMRTIENDAGQVPKWLWDRIQAAIANAEGRTS